jgi:2'-5' RNA ligase
MRLFTALDIPADVRTAMTALLRELRPAAKFQWSPPANLHVTTKFIGEWPAERIPELTAALAAIERTGPFEVAVRGLGWFPNPHNPRVLFAGIEAGPELAELHRRTDAACAGLGIAAETKKFNAHLTLARVRTHEGLPAVRQRIAGLPETDFGVFTARSFHLYESASGPAGTVYTPLEEFSLL